MKGQSGIYKIGSKIKPIYFYIGSALNISNRWGIHLWNLRKNRHHSIILQNHVNKYGIDDLCFSVVEPCFPEWLIRREQFYINLLKPKFNVRLIAESNLGYKMSDESKRKMSENSVWKGKKFSAEHRQKMRDGRKGMKFSEEHKRNIGIASKGNKYGLGKKMSIENRAKLSESLKGNHYRLGIKHTEEVKKVISEKNKGKKDTPEQLIKRIEAHKGLKHSFETKRKQSDVKRGEKNPMFGRILSAETKKRMSEAKKKMWELRRLKNKIIIQEPSLCN